MKQSVGDWLKQSRVERYTIDRHVYAITGVPIKYYFVVLPHGWQAFKQDEFDQQVEGIEVESGLESNALVFRYLDGRAV